MIPIHDTIPSRERPFVTWILITLNAVVFLFEMSLPKQALEALFYNLGLVPARYTHPEWAVVFGLPLDNYWPFLTNMFLHGGWTHILGNMWSLWIFGDNVEDRLGHWRFLLFYLLSGIAAGLVHVMFNPHATIPAVGASGAIAGVMGAYFVMFPTSRVVTLIPIFFIPYIIEIPAVVYLGFWFLSQLFSGTMSLAAPQSVGGIAWWAHVGGFVAGIVLLKILRKRRHRYRRYYDDELTPFYYISSR
jgi:membrane associated rhomboid family serine protease